MKKIFSKINFITYKLNNINKKLDGYLCKTQNAFEEDFKKLFG